MSVFGLGLEDGEIEALRQRYPGFRGEVPPEAHFWSRSEVETFFSSNGLQRPHRTNDASAQTCSLLSRLRVQLADRRIEKVTDEYLSYCRHRKQRTHFCSLPSLKTCTPVTRVREAPQKLQAPVTVVPRRDRDTPAQEWNLQFWAGACPDEVWTCRTRWPAFEADELGVDSFTMEACIAEYAEYMQVIEDMDPECSEEDSLAYPRVQIEGWCPFSTIALQNFEECWKGLSPPGVNDLTPRWCELYASIFDDADWLQHLARFYQLSIGATGTVSRLHVENNGAHVWFTQIEGQKLFFLFPPHEGRKLYEERGGYIDVPEGYANLVSPVDLFFPSEKTHPEACEATAQVALVGEGKTLIVPAGWWWCSIATEPSVTLRHPFWGMENRTRFVDELWAPYEGKDVSPDRREQNRGRFTELRDLISSDTGRDVEDYVVIEGGS